MAAKFNPVDFLKEVVVEAKKIVWPTRKEAIASTISVCIMVFFCSIVLLFIDKIVESGIWFIVSLFEKMLG